MARPPFTDDERTRAALEAVQQVAATLRARREHDADQ
jgi:hypothetical protein